MAALKSLPRHRLFWIFLLTPFFKPAVFGVLEGTELLETLFDLWRLAAAGVISVMYLRGLIRLRRLPSVVMICLGLYLSVVTVSTALSGSNYWTPINRMMTIVCFCMLLEESLRFSPEMTMDMLFYPLSALILSNFVLLCIYPLGLCTGGSYWYSYNLMGIDNLLGPVLVPYMFLVALRSTMQTGDLDWVAYCMIGVSALTLLLTWSATGLMGLAVALIFLLFFYQRKLELLFNAFTALLASFGLFFSVVMFRLQNLFAFFIEGVLHKGLSFTGRTDIWDMAETLFLQKPFLGYGLAINGGKIYRINKGKYYHAHNVFLEVVVEGGILALIPYLLMLAAASKPLMTCRKHPYARLISAGLMACFVMMTMEPFLDNNGLLIYGLIFLGYHVEQLISPVPPAQP